MPNLSPSFNLHIRLTTACNADCAYCSCESETPSQRMPLNHLAKSLDFALTHFLVRSPQKRHCNAEIIGGEVMTLPSDYLKQATQTIRRIVGHRVKHVRVGCQSNLIGSHKKIKALHQTMDDGSIGTSIDSFTNKRTIKGDADKYRQLASKGAHCLKAISGDAIGTVIVFDSDNINRIVDEYKMAQKDQRRITIRPVFAGSNAIAYLEPKLLAKHWRALINLWFIQGETVIEPLMRITKSMLSMRDEAVGCPYLCGCSTNSLNIEPNGDIYICQEMADAKAGKLGNGIHRQWHDKRYLQLSRRQINIDKQCQACQWYSYCQGGCMMEAFTEHGSFYARPNNCTAWKIVFKTIDENINKHGIQTSINWINKIQALALSRIDCSNNKSIARNKPIALTTQ